MSIFDTYTIAEIYQTIQSVYRSQRMPWILGYSGGKDSTVIVQLIWNALAALPREDLQWPVFIIASDTLVETPVIVGHLRQNLAQMNERATAEGLPFSAHTVTPAITDTFWVNLIGRGYAAPNQRFRWCTDRMKIRPANRFILDRAKEWGRVVMVLGSRRAESASRAQVIAKHERDNSVTGTALRYHHVLRQALVYTPIQEWETEDVWTYLLQVPSPWGGSNRDLAAMYRSAQDGECPLVVDETTPSCGSSRFGCWTCTVVTRDKSMEAMIDHGEDWMEQLLAFRDWLTETQIPEKKHLYREHKRRTGKVDIEARTADGERLRGLAAIDAYQAQGGEIVNPKLIRGPYTLSFCQTILRKLLMTQNEIQISGPDPHYQLITEAELHEIRRIWRMERQDWADTVPQIVADVTDLKLAWLHDDIGAFSAQEQSVLSDVCANADVPAEMVAKLLEQERQMQGMHRRAGIFERIDAVLREDWRDEATIRALYNLPDPTLDTTEDDSDLPGIPIQLTLLT